MNLKNLEYIEKNNPVTKEEIDFAEKRINGELPKVYKEFLRYANGMVMNLCVLYDTQRIVESCECNEFAEYAPGYISAIGLMRMFQKAGYFDKKLAFVPILNEYLVFRLAGVQKEFLLYLVSSLASWLLHFNRSLILAAAGAGIFALILRIYMAYELAKHYGTGKLMAAGIVCFPALAYLILGYGKHIYKK